jgi:hypothetical protein
MTGSTFLKKSRLSLLLSAQALFSALFLVSCVLAITPTGPNYSGREDENFQDFMDVPFPSEMTVEKNKTVVFTRRDVLSGHISIVGPLTNDELLDYYDRRLPAHGWTPHAEVQTNSETVSTWAKPGKTLTIMATKPTISIGVKSRIDIWVAPPHTKNDLGHRVIYTDSLSGSKNYSTTPIREGKGSSGRGIGEEDI